VRACVSRALVRDRPRPTGFRAAARRGTTIARSDETDVPQDGASASPSPGSSLGHHLRSLKLRLAGDGTVRVMALSAPVDLLRGGERTLEPPFTLSLEVGDDAGTVAVPCRLGPSGGRCV